MVKKILKKAKEKLAPATIETVFIEWLVPAIREEVKNAADEQFHKWLEALHLRIRIAGKAFPDEKTFLGTIFPKAFEGDEYRDITAQVSFKSISGLNGYHYLNIYYSGKVIGQVYDQGIELFPDYMLIEIFPNLVFKKEMEKSRFKIFVKEK
jgi:hypothetical protein